MTDQYRTIYEFLLEIKLSSQQEIRLQKGIAQYWTQDNTEAIAQTITDLKYYGKTDELESLRGSSQKIIVEAFGEISTIQYQKYLSKPTMLRILNAFN